MNPWSGKFQLRCSGQKFHGLGAILRLITDQSLRWYAESLLIFENDMILLTGQSVRAGPGSNFWPSNDLFIQNQRVNNTSQKEFFEARLFNEG